MKEINRFELIGRNGREIVLKESLSFDIQDCGKTLKVFRIGEIRNKIREFDVSREELKKHKVGQK